MICSKNFDDMRRLNFGWKTHTMPHDSEFLDNQILAYNAVDAGLVQERMRSEGSMTKAIDQLEGIYEAVRSAEPAPAIYSRADLTKDIVAQVSRDRIAAERYSSLARAALLLERLVSKECEP